MSFFGFLLKKKFYLHFGLSIILTVILFFIVLQFIKKYTNHGDTYTLPDFSGKTLADIEAERYDQLYDFIVIDSIFDNNNPKGSIVIQNPPPGSVVKQYRKVYVTLVAYSKEKVEMPNLIDLSLRQAVNTLRSKGLTVNQLQYVQDFAGNAVLEQLYLDEIIEPGTIVVKGSGIDLVVGLGYENYAPIPMLIGLNQREARDAIHKASFNVGTEFFLDEKDDVHSRVYKQKPSWSENQLLFKGNRIDISFRSDLDFDFEAIIEELLQDSLPHPDTTKIVQPEF